MKDAPDRGSAALPCVVYYGHGTSPEAFDLSAEDAVLWRPASELHISRRKDEAAVLIADVSMVPFKDRIHYVPRHVFILTADAEAENAFGGQWSFSIADFPDAKSRARVLRAACRASCLRIRARHRRRKLAATVHELRELNALGASLMLERDRAVLLQNITSRARQLTGSAGGGLFLVESRDEEPPFLRLSHLEVDFDADPTRPDLIVPIDDKSIVGYAAMHKEPVVIDDAYHLPPGAPYSRTGEFDRRHGTRIRSMLHVPMIDHLGNVIGVLVLVNRKSDPDAKIGSEEDADRFVLPYTDREVRLGRSLASQAAVSIENANLYAQIQRIFESFAKAAVTAIDQRDPTTAGHSLRVAALTTDLAKAVERDGRGKYADFHLTSAQLRELRYAATLHDFGKLSVREDVLTKARKLPPPLWERVNARFDLIRRTLEVAHLKARAAVSDDGASAERLDRQFAADLEQVERQREVVRRANEPTVLYEAPAAALRDVARCTFEACDGGTIPYLTDEELHYLQLPKGTLDDRERAEIESHVEETFRYLEQIPWTDDLKNVANFAHGHHEKLDGSGYPRHLEADEIPVEMRLITLADMFDALTASDRPYKPSVSAEKALEILQSEADAGRVDGDLLRILAESKVYERVLKEDWHQL